jgi:hypothetical protein
MAQDKLSSDKWLEDADRALAFIQDADARALILYRFDGQYLPALRAAQAPDMAWRAWEAFRYYLTTRATRRKPFALSGTDADRVIATLTALLNLPPSTPP